MTYAIGNEASLGVACLGITHSHTSGRVKAFQRMPNAKVLGAFDQTPLLDSFVDAMGIAKRTKEEILADPDVHAVLIHPKSYLMADWAIEAMEAGKAVLCEKPAGRGSMDTARLVETVEKTGQLFQVGYCWRYAPSVDKMQEVLKAGQIGKVLQVRAHAGCSHGEADTDHMRQPGDLGGAFYVIGCHTIDRLLLHFGMPRSVNARITKFEGQMPAAAREDAAGAILNDDDKMITIDFMSCDPLPWTEGWDLTAYGTEGVMHSRPLPASYKLYSTGKAGLPEFLRSRFEKLRGEVPGLLHLEVGVDHSRVDYACDVVLYTEFESQEALDAYTTHPAHLRVKDELGQSRIARFQVDYAL